MQIGESIRDYLFEAKIGEGGMGEVWRARHRLLDKAVAIKVMADHLLADPEFEARFIQEARAQSRISHAQIISASDFFQERGRYYLVMPLIEGQSLEARLAENKGPLPIEEALRISLDTLAALDHAHQHAVIHRDVKPSNILLSRDGRAYLTDFGIALMMSHERRTRTGVAVGTPHYMSPEQIRRPRSIDHRTDVYSFGCVLYEMLTGRPPFEAGGEDEETDYVIKEMHIHQTPEPLRNWNPSVPEAIEAIALRALAKNPDERFVSCGEFARALDGTRQPRMDSKKQAAFDDASKMQTPGIAGSNAQPITEKRSAPAQTPQFANAQATGTPPEENDAQFTESDKSGKILTSLSLSIIGALIGGAIGGNKGNSDDAALIGVIVGGMLGFLVGIVSAAVSKASK